MFEQLLNMSISASWVVLAVIALRLVLKKAPKAIHCAMWILVAIRLLLPITVESNFSLMEPEKTQTATSKMLDDYVGSTHTYWYFTSEYDMALDAGMVPIRAEDGGSYVITGTSPFTKPTQLGDVMETIWFFGVVSMGLYALVSYLAVRRKVQVCIKLDKTIFLCDRIDTPFILGILRPQIYLPSELDPTTAGHVLAHEQAHLERRDHWWKPLGFMLLSVYWFNPVLWLAYILLCRDIEQACDEKVVKKLDIAGRKAYSIALLQCSVSRKLIAACPLAFGEAGVKGRIKSVLHYKKPAFWIILVAVIASLAAAVCLLTDPKDGGPTPYNVTSDLWIYDAESADVTVWDHDGSHETYLSQVQIQELCERIHDLEPDEFIRNKPSMPLLYVDLDCKDFDINLYWDGEYAYFSFDAVTDKRITSGRRSVKNEELNAVLTQIVQMEYRLAEGNYVPVNVASLYGVTPDLLSLIENRRYEVTGDGLTVSDLESGDAITYVFDWSWEGHKEAKENLAAFITVSTSPNFLEIDLRMDDNTLKYQHLFDNTHLVLQDERLFLIEGKNNRQEGVADWTVYCLAEYSPYTLPPATYTELFENADHYIQNSQVYIRSGDRRPGWFSLTEEELQTLRTILTQMPEDAIQPGGEIKDCYVALQISCWLTDELRCNGSFWYCDGEIGLYWSSYKTNGIEHYQINDAALAEFLSGLMQPERIESYEISADTEINSAGEYQYVSYTHEDVAISLLKIIGWEYEIVPYVDDHTDFGIRCKPEWLDDWLFFGYMHGELVPEGTFLYEAKVDGGRLGDQWHYLFENPIEGETEWREWPEPWKLIYRHHNGGTYYIYNEGAFDERLAEHDRGGYNVIEDSFDFCLMDEEAVIAMSSHIYPDYENPEVTYDAQTNSYNVIWHKKNSDGYIVLNVGVLGTSTVSYVEGTQKE